MMILKAISIVYIIYSIYVWIISIKDDDKKSKSNTVLKYIFLVMTLLTYVYILAA